MKAGLLIFYFFIFFTGCKSKKIPDDILPKPKMEAVLWDLVRADKFLSDFVFFKDSSLNKDTTSIRLYQRVFLIHHITREEFQKSFAFYRTHPELLKIVLDSLNARSNSPMENKYQQHPVIDTTHSFKKIKPFPHIKN